MGADIHAYIEYAQPSSNDKLHWTPFAGQLSLWRDYNLFGKIAGVRGEGPVFPLRGMPDDLGYEASGDCCLYINDENPDQEGHCSRENAERWVESGISEWKWDKRKVTHPDWHSHTWLSTDEFRQILQMPCEHGSVHECYLAALAAMEALQAAGNHVRIVIWFDN